MAGVFRPATGGSPKESSLLHGAWRPQNALILPWKKIRKNTKLRACLYIIYIFHYISQAFKEHTATAVGRIGFSARRSGFLWIRGSKVDFRSGGLTSFATLGGKTQKWKMDSVVIFCEQIGISVFF